MILAGTQAGLSSGGGGQTQCDPVVFDPTEGDAPDTVLISTPTVGAHIFFTRGGSPPPKPTHSGDNPTGTTSRIGSNAGSVTIGSGGGFLKALAYKPGLLDSVVTQAGPWIPAGGGG